MKPPAAARTTLATTAYTILCYMIDSAGLYGELLEDDVEHLDGLLRCVGLPPGDELAEVVMYSLSLQEGRPGKQ